MSPSVHQADPQMCDIHLEHDRHLIQGMDTASPEPDSPHSYHWYIQFNR